MLVEANCECFVIDFGIVGFYAAVEILDNPNLKGKPVGVGSVGGVLSTASYEARKFGCRSAMPGFIAKRLCPKLIFVPPRFARYQELSDLFYEKVLKTYDENCQRASLDEAYVDLTNWEDFGDSLDGVVEQLRKKIHDVSGLTASCGVGPNRLLAKLATDMNKPNGQTILKSDRDSVVRFMSTLPLRKVPGVGKVLEKQLTSLELKTCGDVYANCALLSLTFKEKSFMHLLTSALGIGSTVVGERSRRKGISSERTFATIRSEREISDWLHKVVTNLVHHMSKEKLRGRSITVKLKTSDFRLRSRSKTLERYIHEHKDIEKEAWGIIKLELPLELRLLGVRMSNFEGVGSAVVLSPKQTHMDKFLHQPEKDPSNPKSIVPSNSTEYVPKDTASIEVTNCSESIDSPPRCDPPKRRRNTLSTGIGISMKKVMCPVCESKTFISPVALNTHIDECLRGSANDEKKVSRKTVKRFWQEGKKKSNDLKQRDQVDLQGHRANERDERRTASEITCPICSEYKCRSEDTMSRHVDTCLTQTSNKPQRTIENALEPLADAKAQSKNEESRKGVKRKRPLDAAEESSSKNRRFYETT